MKHLTRQADLIPLAILGAKINIIGAGAIGSFTTLALAKMGFSNLELWDFDDIDVVNMSSQFYRFKDIGRPKVEALKEIVKDFTDVDIKINKGKWAGERAHITVTCVDNMATRSQAYNDLKGKIGAKYLVDPRMGGEAANLYVCDLMNFDDPYHKTLKSDDQIPNEPCTAKATMYTCLMLSGLTSQTVKDCLLRKHKTNIGWDIKDYAFMAF